MVNDKSYLVIAYDRLGPTQAGPAIRTLALVNQLASVGSVDVIHEGEPPKQGIEGVKFIEKSTVQPSNDFFSRYTAVLAPPLVAMTMPEVLDSEVPLVIDLFDPVVWENLELYSRETGKERIFQHERHLASLMTAMIRGDYFIVAGERQLDLVTGALMVLNRINPVTWQQGMGPEQLVGKIPFGVPDENPPSPDQLPVPPGYECDGPLVVWGGGMWDWLNPELVVSAWAELIKSHPKAVLAFPGTVHPNPHVPEMESVKRVKKLAKELGILTSIRFGQWLEREEYLGLLLHASCGVSAHSPGLEARYAARTRFLDAVWVGLPMVVTAGDEYAQYIADHDLGEVVSEFDPVPFARALRRTIETGRENLQDRITGVRRNLSWKKMAQPLIKWAQEPKITHGPGSDFFQSAIGDTSPHERPSDFLSLLGRIKSKLNKR